MGLLASCLGPFAPGVCAQEVRGRLVVEGSAGEAIEGALVALVDGAAGAPGRAPADREVDAVFTGATGFFRLMAPEPGSYRLKIDRIGFESWTSEPLALAAGEARSVEFAIPIRPVRLAALDVRVRRGCLGDPRQEAELYTVWDEARKALEAARLARRQRLLRFDAITFDRRFSLRGQPPLEVSTTGTRGTPLTPFRSLPADELSREGYVRRDGETAYYYGPDASVLLSDTFLSDHCFGLDRDEVDGRRLVGLTFEPHEDRDVPDIEGVLWLDEETAELDRVEFEYRELPYPGIDDGRIGGRIDFRRLSTGAFVVDDWVLRMPVLAQTEDDRRRDRYRLGGFTEHGGELRAAYTPEGEELAWRRGASIRGAILDPLSGEPLRDATVILDQPRGPDLMRHTGPGGAFAFDELRAGKHEVELFHPMFRLVGWDEPKVELELADLEAAVVAFELPQSAEVLARRCGRDAEGGLVLGRVVDSAGVPPWRASVWAEWSRPTQRDVPGDPAVGPRIRSDIVRTDREGRYALCGLPLQSVLDLYLKGPVELVSRRVATVREVVVVDIEIESLES